MGRKNNQHESIKTYIKALIILIIGILVISLLKHKEDISSVNYIERRNKEESISLMAISKYGQDEVEMNILPYKISDEQLSEMIGEFKNQVRIKILGENISFLNVTQKLNLVNEIEGYPFEIEYRIFPRDIFSESGEILANDVVNENVEINMIYKYEDFEYMDQINVKLAKSIKTEGEEFKEGLIQFLENENVNSRDKYRLDLPKELNGSEVEWRIIQSNKIPAIMFLTVVCIVYVLVQSSLKKREENKKRQENIKQNYPKFASKYSLLAETGLPHRQIIERMCTDYVNKDKGNAMGEELKIVVHEMKSGVSQTDALNHMAIRCQLKEMTHFVSLINQNIKRGGNTIAEQIKIAALESIEMEKEELRKNAERSGTKLLFPMFIMLVIVFVLIMIPAFNSFSF